MATLLGNNSYPSAAAEWWGSSSYNQHMIILTLPAGGPWRVPTLGAWFAGVNVSVQAVLCMWNGSGIAVGYTSGFTVTGRPFGLGQVDYYERAITSPAGGPTLNPGSYYVGFSRDPAGAAQFSMYSGGSHDDDASTSMPENMVGNVSDFSGTLSAWLYYELANSAPNAPTNLSPTGGVLLTGADLTPALSWLYTDPESNNSSAYQVQIDNNSDFSSPVWDSGKTALVQAHNTTMIVSPPSNLSRGVLYYWRARVWDSGDLVSGWSA